LGVGVHRVVLISLNGWRGERIIENGKKSKGGKSRFGERRKERREEKKMEKSRRAGMKEIKWE